MDGGGVVHSDLLKQTMQKICTGIIVVGRLYTPPPSVVYHSGLQQFRGGDSDFTSSFFEGISYESLPYEEKKEGFLNILGLSSSPK